MGISTAVPGRNLDVTGNWGGNVVIDNQVNTVNSTTITESTKALAYYLTNNTGTTNSAINTIFNITGLPNTDGTFAFIEIQTIKGITAVARVETVTIQINGTQISTVATPSQTGAATTTENYTVVRSHGVWRVTGAPGTADSADLAEWIAYTGDAPSAGELVSISNQNESVQRSSITYDPMLVGVIATQPHTLMGKYSENSTMLALAGRVTVKVSAENGAIKNGDYLTSSSLAGTAMKATRSGMVVGQALTSFDGEGTGEVIMLIKNTYHSSGDESVLLGDIYSIIGDVNATTTATSTEIGLSSLVTTIQSEIARDPIVVIGDKISGKIQFLTDFVSARVTAIRGYFNEIFAKKIHTEQICVKKSDGSEICVDGDQLDTMVRDSNLTPNIQTSAKNKATTSPPMVSPTGISTSTAEVSALVSDSTSSATSSNPSTPTEGQNSPTPPETPTPDTAPTSPTESPAPVPTETPPAPTVAPQAAVEVQP